MPAYAGLLVKAGLLSVVASAAVFSVSAASNVFDGQSMLRWLLDRSGKEGELDSNPQDFDIFVMLATEAGLDTKFNAPDRGGQRNITLFAPPDRAFYRLAKTLGYRPDLQLLLKRAKTLWETSALGDYQYRYHHGCGICHPDYALPMNVQVREGQLYSVVYAEDAWYTPDWYTPNATEKIAIDVPTVDELFATIQSAYDRNAYIVEAKFDATYGHPTSISIDWYRNAWDDTRGHSVNELVEIETESLAELVPIETDRRSYSFTDTADPSRNTSTAMASGRSHQIMADLPSAGVGDDVSNSQGGSATRTGDPKYNEVDVLNYLNGALDRYASAKGQSKREVLRALVLRHVGYGTNSVRELIRMGRITTKQPALDGDVLLGVSATVPSGNTKKRVSLRDDNSRWRYCRISMRTKNVRTSNGFVHVIKNALVPFPDWRKKVATEWS